MAISVKFSALGMVRTIVFASILFTVLARGQETEAVLGNSNTWQHYDWLQPSVTPAATAPDGKLTATAGQNMGDPFAVVAGNALWQENYGANYTQAVNPALTLSYETDAVTGTNAFSDASLGDLSNDQKAALQLQPIEQFTLRGEVHDSSSDPGSPDAATETRGSGFTAEGHLPYDSVIMIDGRSDVTDPGAGGLISADNAYDAQFKQPISKLPVTAVVKGHYETTSGNGGLATRLATLEPSFVWKAGDSTTLQAGVRQQQYQNFPGISNLLNESVFADWSQAVLPEVTWHSYAEVLNSQARDLAPAAPATSGANGTPQSNDPTNNLALPNSLSDETLTFSTGPSFKLQKDISASVEYSNRIAPGSIPGEAPSEQRVSVSLKGTF